MMHIRQAIEKVKKYFNQFSIGQKHLEMLVSTNFDSGYINTLDKHFTRIIKGAQMHAGYIYIYIYIQYIL